VVEVGIIGLRMRGSLSLTALAAIIATASSAIIPIAEESGRVLAHAVPEAPAQPGSNAFHIIPPWLESLIESYVRAMWLCGGFC
jgi:hypothetical protein